MVQGALFTKAFGDPSVSRFAKVAVELPVEGTFDYRIPDILKNSVKPGTRVQVSFSGRRANGICLGVSKTASVHDPYDLLDVLDEKPLVSENLLVLIRWIAGYYCCPIGEVFSAALPKSARTFAKQRVTWGARLKIQASDALKLAEELIEKRPKQARVIRLLAGSDELMPLAELCSRANVSRSPVNTLSGNNVLELCPLERPGIFSQEKAASFPKPDRLTDEQSRALETIMSCMEKHERSDFLLYGVTGSGKTEIYLQAIEEMITRGKGAIVLVPEISLTPQTISRFKGRFERVAVLHSRLSDKERYAQWKSIQNGEADVVVGARSAVFAPMPRLGLIVVDEEHETSFKQQNTPCYHARTVALKRGEIEEAFTILGTATPSLEACLDAQKKTLKPLVLRHRAGKMCFPIVYVINMNHEKSYKGKFLSRALKTKISETLGNKNQTILFLNRRGYYTVIICTACSEPVKCPSCDISLTLHMKANRLICHYCGHESMPPDSCPSCKSGKMIKIGAGTERVEHEISALFPQARVQRMDSDTMLGRNAHEKALKSFKSRETDILIGTQMIAKGLDFPHVTLVGVICADTPLYQPDFRSCERAFQLLSQVSGRAGRGADGGSVLVQTYNPDHYSIRHAIKNDYYSFAREELSMREKAGYPPFTRMIRAVFSGKESMAVEKMAMGAGEALAGIKLSDTTKLLGPAAAPITMIKKRYRWHLLAKTSHEKDLDSITSALKEFFRKTKRALGKDSRMALDVDPLSML